MSDDSRTIPQNATFREEQLRASIPCRLAARPGSLARSTCTCSRLDELEASSAGPGRRRRRRVGDPERSNCSPVPGPSRASAVAPLRHPIRASSTSLSDIAENFELILGRERVRRRARVTPLEQTARGLSEHFCASSSSRSEACPVRSTRPSVTQFGCPVIRSFSSRPTCYRRVKTSIFLLVHPPLRHSLDAFLDGAGFGESNRVRSQTDRRLSRCSGHVPAGDKLLQVYLPAP